MKMHKWIVATFAVAALSTAAIAADGWERDSAYNKNYNPKSIQTITGKVLKIDRNFRPLAGMEPGFMATTKTEKGEEVQVQVGPIWFTSFYHQKWNIQVGDTVKVTGSRVKIGGKDVLMVSQAEKGNLKMAVRGKAGVPIWDLQPQDF
jgi:hypothetical protein